MDVEVHFEVQRKGQIDVVVGVDVEDASGAANGEQLKLRKILDWKRMLIMWLC